MKRTNLALAACVAGWTAIAPAQQPATLEEALKQIEALKKQMTELEKFVKEQVPQRTTPAPATATPPAPPPTEKAPDSGFVKWNELLLGKSRFKLYDWTLANIDSG